MENTSKAANLQEVIAQEETPRMKCLREAQEAHLRCLSTAKTDAEKSACHAALSKAERACPAN